MRFIGAAALLLTSSSSLLSAQAWSYPALQPPRVVSREFNFGVADAGSGGTSLLFQWREMGTEKTQFSMDAGIVAPDARRDDNRAFVFGQYARQLHRSTNDIPLDLLLTAGAGISLGSGTTLRLPVGLSVGQRFELDRQMAITPFVHPRISLDMCSCRGNDDSSLGVAFDLGANFEASPQLSLRAALLFASNESYNNNGFGLSLAWRPPALRR